MYLTDQAAVSILPPAATNAHIQMFQSLSGTYGSQSFQMDAFLILNQQEINVTLMNSFGTTMGTLLYTADTLEFDSSLFPQSIDPAYIVFDFQLCFYDQQALRQELEGAGLRLETADSPNHGLREVYDGENLIITIMRSQDRIEFSNIYRDYSYTIHGDFIGI